MGIGLTGAVLFGIGVTVALVPEGLLPTVTLSLARGAQQMAHRNALVRRLESVETLGATTFVCTDKTGTLTRNEMAVVEAWTPVGRITVSGAGYDPVGEVHGDPAAIALARQATLGARSCVVGRLVRRGEQWLPEGDPMEVAIDAAARRLGGIPATPHGARMPFTPRRLCSAAVVDGHAWVLGAPEVVLGRCAGPREVLARARSVLAELADQGRRVVAVGRVPTDAADATELERAVAGGLELTALLGIEDPPRPDVGEAVAACRRAGIRVAMITGDNVRTAAAIAREVGLLRPGGPVVEGADLPAAPEAVADLLDHDEGAVVARVTPRDKLRIAQALRSRGHVVAMTGDGVNDAAALRGADVGVAMGRSGSDVAREAADLVLLDDHFATIVRAVELGRATFANIRRFLTYHLTDNVAELVPFVVWALTGGYVPLAIGVIQVLALDIGTDMLPAVALGAEPPSRRTMDGPRRHTDVVDGQVLRRALLVLGPTEALASMAGFVVVLLLGGWSPGTAPAADLLAAASGTAFATIALMQILNAFACRSETTPAWRLDPRTNRLLLVSVLAEAVLLVVFLTVPWLTALLGGSWPPPSGWLLAGLGAAALPVVDGLHKARRRAAGGPGRRRARRPRRGLVLNGRSEAAGRGSRRSHRPV
jgi:magnesium-transporting ATPase (P-type)